jgi:anti-sigma factor RsiW
MRWRRRPRRLTCPEVVERVTDYLEGALAPAMRRRFEAHLEGCPDCMAYVVGFTQTVNALGELPPDEPSDDAVASLVAAYRRLRLPAPPE